MVIDKELKAEQGWGRLIVPFFSHVSKFHHLKNEKIWLPLKIRGKNTEDMLYFQMPIYRF